MFFSHDRSRAVKPADTAVKPALPLPFAAGCSLVLTGIVLVFLPGQGLPGSLGFPVLLWGSAVLIAAQTLQPLKRPQLSGPQKCEKENVTYGNE